MATFTATSGVDNFNFTGGADILNFTASNQANTETFDGANGSDVIRIAAGLTIDLRSPTFLNFESIVFLGAGGITVNQTQLAGLGSSFTGVNALLQTLSINTSTSFNASSLTLTTWESTDTITITGAAGSQTLTGRAGVNNILDGGTGADALIGSTANDIYFVDDAGDTVTDTGGTDEVRTSLASYTLGTGIETLTGTVNTGQILTGNASANTITGGTGGDTIDGGTGADTMNGGAGNDIYVVDNVGDSITDSSGTDEVRTSLASYTLGSGLENLTGTVNTGQALSGNADANTITGGTGNDTLTGGGLADTLIGGSGDDTYNVDGIYYGDGTFDVVVELAGGGTDTVVSSGTYRLEDFVENLVLTGTAVYGYGNSLDNTLTGNSSNNLLDGDVGADTMIGGLGDDRYDVDNAGDIVTESASAGTDLVRSTVTYALSGNVENLTLMGSANTNATGNTLNNVLRGNAGANTLDGGAGADTMYGGTGDDIYVVDNAGDVASEAAGGGTDAVLSSISYVLRADVENLTLTGSSAINGSGNDLANVINGNSASNVLDGRAGADTMNGGLGDDIYYVDNAGDAAVEAGGEGVDTIRSTVSYSLSENFENLSLIGTADVDGNGNELNNYIVGNSGANVLNGGLGSDGLNGGAGNDTLIGGAGADSLNGAAGADTFAFSTGDSGDTGATADRIFTFSTAEGDKVDLSGWDADSGTGGLQGFDYIGSAAFTGTAGELRVVENGAISYITGDTDGDGTADFMIVVNHAVGQGPLGISDFIL